MTFVAVAIAGAAAVGAGASVYGANQQKSAANKASATQMQMFGVQQSALDPYQKAGKGAAYGLRTGLGSALMDPATGQLTRSGYDPNAPLMKSFGLGDFHESPAYQFNLQQGLDAVNKAAAARGGGNFYAPQTLQDIGRFSQGLASNEFWNARGAFNEDQQNKFNRLYQLANLGESAAAGVGAGALQTGALVGSNQIGAGNAQAAGIMGASNAITGGIGNAYNAYLLNSVLQQGQAGGGIYPQMGATGGNAGYAYGPTSLEFVP